MSVLALLLIVLLALATVQPGRGSGNPTASGPSSGSGLQVSSGGIIIPLYTAPGPDWDSVAQAKQQFPNLPFIVIVNPDNGPGTSQRFDFASGIGSLKGVGVSVFGYVYTDYGKRNISSVEAEISNYKAWYGVAGIFYDGMPNVPGYETYYSTLNSYAKSLGLDTAGNPGTPLPQSYTGILDIYVLDEGPTPPTSPGPFPVGSTASLIYDVPAISPQYVSALSKLSGYVYITNQNLPNPYNGLPTYFDSLVSILAGSQSEPGSSSTTGSPPPAGPTVRITSASDDGSALTGVWTVVKAGGWGVASGFTPLSYNAAAGVSYTISMTNFDGHVLDRWSTGAAANSVSITPTASTNLTAYFKAGETVPLEVMSAGRSGVPIVGLWVEISMNGVLVDAGFTPLSWEAAAGQAYAVQTDNYSDYKFTNWVGGSMSDPVSVTPESALNLTAVYSFPSPSSTTAPAGPTGAAAGLSSTSAPYASTGQGVATTPAPSTANPPSQPARGNARSGARSALLTYAAFAGVAGAPAALVAAFMFVEPLRRLLSRAAGRTRKR